MSLDDFSRSTSSIIVGDGYPADRLWTKAEFTALCRLLHNDKAEAADYLLVYRSSDGAPQFKRAKRCQLKRRIAWAWETIAGRAKKQAGIGFYPTSNESRTRWAALDFDGHDGNGERPRRFAVAVLDLVVRRLPDLNVILATSGSQGWHVFLIADELRDIEEWTKLLKQLTDSVGATVQPGECEIFPRETRNGGWPYGIRAPGTWNPKTGVCGRIFFENVGPLLKRAIEAEKRKAEQKKKSTSLYLAATQQDGIQLHDSAGTLYRGEGSRWQHEFAITIPGTRNAQLKRLVHAIYRQASRYVARANAVLQYHEAKPRPRASLEEHLGEFDELWKWTAEKWVRALPEDERERFNEFDTDHQRDFYRVVKNFADLADLARSEDFPIAVTNVSERLHVSTQYVSKMRELFVRRRILILTSLHVTNRRAARYRWCCPALGVSTNGECDKPSGIEPTAGLPITPQAPNKGSPLHWQALLRKFGYAPPDIPKVWEKLLPELKALYDGEFPKYMEDLKRRYESHK